MKKYILITKPTDDDIRDAVKYQGNIPLLFEEIKEALENGVMITMTYMKDNITVKIINQAEKHQIMYCPTCYGSVYIEQINCGEFIHACLKANFTQVNPHMSRVDMLALIEDGIIWGCGSKFKVVPNEKGFLVEETDYG
jgi:hypothetical protein